MLGERHGQHRRVGTTGSTHEPRPRDDQLHRVFEREDVGQQRGDVFTEAVSDYGVGFDAERHPLSGERNFGDEHGREGRDGVA